MRKFSAVIFFLTFWLVFPPAAQALSVEYYNGYPVVANELLVEYTGQLDPILQPQSISAEDEALDIEEITVIEEKDDDEDDQEQNAAEQNVLSARKNKPKKYHRMKFRRGTVAEALPLLRQKTYVKSAQPNYIYFSQIVPNDQYYIHQWAHEKTHAESAWNISTGSRNVVVAVVDSGINAEHPDLVDNMWTGTANGKTVHGWDFFDKDSDPNDTIGHGTAVAGVIGGVGNNAIGVAGVNWNVKLMALRVVGLINADAGQQAAATSEMIMLAEIFAAEHGADIVNLSMGLLDPNCDPAVGFPEQPLEKELIRRLTYESNILIVTAAGNEKKNANCLTPTFYDDVLTVTATNNTDHAASYSNFGPAAWKTKKIIAAPGGDGSCGLSNCPLTTSFDFGYVAPRGTSFAAPYVSGAAALVLSVKNFTPIALRQHLIDTADDVVDPQSLNGRTGITYGKRVNVQRALENLGSVTPTMPPLTPPVSPTPGCGPVGDIDCSGAVDAADLALLLMSYGTSGASGGSRDLDQSGSVAIFDLSMLLSNFGQ